MVWVHPFPRCGPILVRRNRTGVCRELLPDLRGPIRELTGWSALADHSLSEYAVQCTPDHRVAAAVGPVGLRELGARDWDVADHQAVAAVITMIANPPRPIPKAARDDPAERSPVYSRDPNNPRCSLFGGGRVRSGGRLYCGSADEAHDFGDRSGTDSACTPGDSGSPAEAHRTARRTRPEAGHPRHPGGVAEGANVDAARRIRHPGDRPDRRVRLPVRELNAVRPRPGLCAPFTS